MRQAFRDLGPADQMSEQRKVTKMVRAFQVPGIDHLDAMVTGDANRMNNFEAAGVFLSDQIAALRTKNIGSHPSRLAAVDSRKNDRRNLPHKKSQKTKHPLGNAGGNARGFDERDPGKYVTGKVWAKFEPEEQEAARKARME